MSEIDLLIFDEAHHAVKRHPYNLVMREFYHQARNLKFLKLISLPSPLQLSLFRVS
jgi:ERCC4-related helicase